MAPTVYTGSAHPPGRLRRAAGLECKPRGVGERKRLGIRSEKEMGQLESAQKGKTESGGGWGFLSL